MWSPYLESLSCCRFRSTGVPYLSERAHHQHGTPVSMSEEYEDDFENCYEEDFESEDGGLEVPTLQERPQQLYTEIDPIDAPSGAAGAAASQLDKQAWPSLSTALQSPPSKSRRHAAVPALFGRSFFAVDPVSGPISSSSGGTATANSDACITLQPPLPALDDTQRRQAAAVLRRSKQLQAQVKLHASTQLDLFVLHPLSLYQQYSQGVGVYAGRAAAACQTRQLNQDIREQDIQTEQIEQQPGSCQVPEDLYSSSRTQQQHAGVLAQARGPLPADLLAASDPAFAEFMEWAIPQVLFELQRAEAEAAAESTLISAAAGPSFAAVQTAVHAADSSSNSSTAAGLQKLLAGELKLPCEGLLSGRPVVGIAGPPTPQAATTAAAAVTAAVPTAAAGGGGGVSSHLLLACYGPVGNTPVSDHGLAGLGCLCVWDLLLLSSSKAQGHKPAVAAAAAGAGDAAGASIVPRGVLQLLVSEGRPTCCCWGAGEAATLVFAGMEEGGIGCWDLAEPDKAHATAQPHSTRHQPQQQQQQRQRQQQQQQIHGFAVPARRPSYSTELPLFAGPASSNNFVDSHADSTKGSSSSGGGGSSVFTSLLSEGALAAGGITALASVPTVSGHSSYGSAAGAGGGMVCRLVVLSAGGCVALYSVMLGDARSDVAVTDLGIRSGSRVWLVKVCEGLPLGMEVVKPPHMKCSAAATAALTAKDAGTKAAPDSNSSSSSSRSHVQAPSGSCLLVLPGATQQLLVGTDGGRVLKGAALGVTQPPHEYTSVQWWPGLQSCAAQDTSAVLDAGVQGDAATAGRFAGSSSRLSGGGSWLGAVTSLSVCPLLPDAWAAGHSCGRVAVFSQKRSRPCWVWQHPTGAPVVAVRWLPQSCVLLAAFGGNNSSSSSVGCLAAFNFALTTKPQPAAVVALQSAASRNSSGPTLQASRDGSEDRQLPSTSHGQPGCIEVLSMSGNSTSLLSSCKLDTGSSSSRRGLQHCSSSSRNPNSSRRQQQQGLRVCVAVGFSDGSCSVYELDAGWSNAGQSSKTGLETLQAVTSS